MMRLGDMLLSARVVSELQLNAALAEQQRWGGKLGQILVRMGALTEDLLVLALSRQLNLPRADLDAIQAIPEALKERLDLATCERYHIVPLAYVAERRAMQLAMSDPFDVVAADDLTRLLGTRIEPFLAGDDAIGAAIRRLYSATTATQALSSSEDAMSLMDNAGNARANRSVPSAAPTSTPSTPTMQSSTPTMQSSTPAAAAAAAELQATSDFPSRVDEQLRAVRAVAALLVERGVVRSDEVPGGRTPGPR